MRKTKPRRCRAEIKTNRGGAIYIVVLMSALVVAVTGLAGLQLARIQNSLSSDGDNFIEARLIARSAIDIGMLKIRNDPNWRTSLGNGTWVNNQPLGDGTYSLWAIDPIDNDVTKGDNHPIVLTGIGMLGGAAFKTSVRLEVGPRTGSCLEVSMISGQDSTVNSATLTSDQTVSSNGSYHANSATVNADVEALSGINGSTYTKSTVNRTTAREMPDPADVLSYYLANGTTINYSDLPQWTQTEMVTNGSFEANLSGWQAVNGTAVLQQSTSEVNQGTYAMKVKSRSVAAAVAAQNLNVNQLTSGNTYQLWVPIYPTADGNASAVLTLTSTGEGVQTFSTPTITYVKSAWNDLKGNVTPTWTGTLTAATLSISISVKNDYYMDAVSLLDVTYPNSVYVIDRQLLSPSVNPFGSHQTNAQGIYIINCSNNKVVLGRMRIVGTLVFVDPHNNSQIQGPVIWEPAIYNFPALLSNDNLEIGFNAAVGMNESSLGVNLNPPGTPYPYSGGSENATLTDSYPSKISGLVYIKKHANFAGAPSISGVVIVEQNITVAANSLTLSYSSNFMNDPPPGFDIGTLTMKIVPGTWKRSID